MHAWGISNFRSKRCDHIVSKINTKLQECGIYTCFIEENIRSSMSQLQLSRNQSQSNMSDNTSNQDESVEDSEDMKNASQLSIDAIENSQCCIVFISEDYIHRVRGEKGSDDICKKEFDYACLNKTPSLMIPVVIDEACTTQEAWVGPIGMNLGSSSFITCLRDTQDSIELAVEDIRSELKKRAVLIMTGKSPSATPMEMRQESERRLSYSKLNISELLEDEKCCLLDSTEECRICIAQQTGDCMEGMVSLIARCFSEASFCCEWSVNNCKKESEFNYKVIQAYVQEVKALNSVFTVTEFFKRQWKLSSVEVTYRAATYLV